MGKMTELMFEIVQNLTAMLVVSYPNLEYEIAQDLVLTHIENLINEAQNISASKFE